MKRFRGFFRHMIEIWDVELYNGHNCNENVNDLEQLPCGLRLLYRKTLEISENSHEL